MLHEQFDIVIVGGGLVGTTLACALSGLGLRLAVVEAQAEIEKGGSSGDGRAIALAHGSRHIFAALGLWEALREQAAPIWAIHVSERGAFGSARFTREEEGVDALGYVVTARALGRALEEQARGLADVSWFRPAGVRALHCGSEHALLTITPAGERRRLGARLVVACDGAGSAVRAQLQTAVTRWDYGQCAIASSVAPARCHQSVAYERFTRGGPIALLPLREGRCAVIWTVPSPRTEPLLAMPEGDFLAALQEQFGARLGALRRLGPRQAYPLSLVRARKSVHRRLVLLGNAAHALHPVAGQGLNLGLRDAATLAEVVAEAIWTGGDPGGEETLARYADWRAPDQNTVSALTDILARLFTVPLPPFALARGLGLVAFDLLPALKRRFSRQTMGLAGRLPRLARGLALVRLPADKTMAAP